MVVETGEKSMKTLMSLCLGAILTASFASSVACASTITEENAEKVASVIEAAVLAHGGSAGLRNLKTLVVQSERINHAVDQSRGTEPPWDKNEATDISAVDVENSVFFNHNINNGFGFQGDNVTLINADESYQADFRAGTIARISEPDFATTSGPFVRVTPTLLVRALSERSGNAHYLGETMLEGRPHDVVAFSMTVGPAISLYFDRETGLLSRSERILPAFGLVAYEFDGYHKIDGVPVNRTFNLYLNGELNVEQANLRTRINAPLDEMLDIKAGLTPIPEVQPDPVARQEIADGVWLIGGNGTYAMFVDMGDYLFAAGGAAGIPERIELLREVTGDKPLRYGMLTHHHFDHVLGVTAYEAEGATVIAAAAHEAKAREAAENGDALKLQTVDDRMTLESDERTLHVIDIGPTAHTEHLLVAYLPEEGILFEADHFTPPAAGPVPPATRSTRSFAEAIARNELAVTRIYTAHSGRAATLDDVLAALDAELFQASRR